MSEIENIFNLIDYLKIKNCRVRLKNICDFIDNFKIKNNNEKGHG